MEHVKTFLDSSTIHGLSWISGTRKWSRIAWILIVIGGFTGAGFLIYESFSNWKQSPISTTIETLPISQITFPKITICPPKNLFLNLNYDIRQAKKIKLTNASRGKLFETAVNLFQNGTFHEIMRNLSILEDPDRYYNWYHGYTRLQYPFYEENSNQLRETFN